MKLTCDIRHTTEVNEYGIEADCTYSTCPRCGQEKMSWGTTDKSIKRCLVLLHNECPSGENNFYVH